MHEACVKTHVMYLNQIAFLARRGELARRPKLTRAS